MSGVDVLMIAHNRADYLSLSLPRVLDTLPEHARLWVWQNTRHAATSKVIQDNRGHPRFHSHQVSPNNAGVNDPTRWFWGQAPGDLLGKVDDDCLVPGGWIETFEQAHDDAPELGVVACWHFQADELRPDTIADRAVELPGGHTIIQNCWVGGSGYLVKRELVVDRRLDDRHTFTAACIDIAATGRVVGWYYPLVVQDHMDDPRSPNTCLHSDRDLLERMPLSAARLPEPTLAAWQRQLENSAVTVQTASLRPNDHRGWRPRARRLAETAKASLPGRAR